uniref:Thioredoxin domain-containing protein n=1 Tax=Phasianus colchicus TaxID=9054 RepID=A0A669PNH3_PHACC
MTHSDLILIFMLAVVDAYQAWCGPCKTVVDLFRRIRNEVSSDLLHFAVAEVDSIDALEKYRGKCEPIFLFYTVSEKVLEHKSYGEQLRELEWISLEKKRLRADLITPCNCNRMRGDGLTLCQGEVRLAVRHCTAAQGGGGITIPGGAQSCGDVALRAVGMVGWAGIGPEDLRGLFQPQ